MDTEVQQQEQTLPSPQSKPFLFSKLLIILFVVGTMVIGVYIGSMIYTSRNQLTTFKLASQPTPTITTVAFNYKKRLFDQNQTLYPGGQLDYPTEVKNVSDKKLTAFDCYETTYTIEKLQEDNDYTTGEGINLNVPIKKIIRDSVSTLGWLNNKPKQLAIFATFCESENGQHFYWLNKEWERTDPPSNEYVSTKVYFYTYNTADDINTLRAAIFADSGFGSQQKVEPLQLTIDNHLYVLDTPRDPGHDYFSIFDINLNLENSYKVVMQKDCDTNKSPTQCSGK